MDIKPTKTLVKVAGERQRFYKEAAKFVFETTTDIAQV